MAEFRLMQPADLPALCELSKPPLETRPPLRSLC